MHLYRIMTDVRSPASQLKERGVAARGIATVWVEADSPETAIKRGREVIENRHYSGTGEITLFREENTHVASDSFVDAREGLAEAYVATKTDALRHRNGLFEIWFPPTWN